MAMLRHVNASGYMYVYAYLSMAMPGHVNASGYMYVYVSICLGLSMDMPVHRSAFFRWAYYAYIRLKIQIAAVIGASRQLYYYATHTQ